MNDDFYRRFEERYRGARGLILSRLRAYMPFVEGLAILYPGAATLDLGCGRGEWLEMMTIAGFKPLGVDYNKAMRKACMELGLPAEEADAATFLCRLPSESHAIITAFHLVEHLTFEQQLIVVREAFRVLKPGGLLIMETPNPENMKVATYHFHIDPTHHRPIPPPLLCFLAEHHGFARVKTVRLNEDKTLSAKTGPTLSEVLGGASPDYAVIAQKPAGSDVLQQLDAPFLDEYGLRSETLLQRYDQHRAAELQRMESKVNQALALAQAADTAARKAEQALHIVHASRSWRITRPLRWIGLQVRLLRDACISVRGGTHLSNGLESMLQNTVTTIDAHPALRRIIVAFSERIRTYAPVRAVYHQLRGRFSRERCLSHDLAILNPEYAQLTPSARRIHDQIQAAAEEDRKEPSACES